ncbi:PPOX class F420-dependent oxidoreductase [Ktedonospora formicarum]|nr:PPOX class F420-dependent oxidoreductase [Ktedonospora formicarum]
MLIISEQTQNILQSKAFAHVATIGPKGEPQVSPVLFGWDGTYLYFGMNKIRQKHRNLKREPRIALSLINPTDNFSSIEIRGVVDRIEDDVDYQVLHRISQKYFNRDASADIQPGEERVVIYVKPERVFAFPPTNSEK